MARKQISRARRSTAQSVTAPVGGLNDRDSLANMPDSDALILDNWFPKTHSVDIRGGCIEVSNGIAVTGETLLSYNGKTTKKLFAAAGTVIYNVDTLVSTSVRTGMTNARWDYVNFGNTNNVASYLVCVNGADLPQFYNGTAWAQSDGLSYATAITDALGLLGAPIGHTFSQVNVWKNRLFFVEKNTMRCWYLGTQAIGGAAAPLDFSGVAKLGGTLIATCSVTTSAGVTVDDYFCAITSEGECMVYRGTDPSDAAKFALVGTYRIGRPIANGLDMMGGRWLAKFSSDVIAITADGFAKLKDAIEVDVTAEKKTINDKIINTVTTDVSSKQALFGWQVMLAPMNNMLIINVPSTELLESYQYVMNTITGAWAKFTGLNVVNFAYHNNDIYGIIGTKVYKFDESGLNDLVPADGSTQGTIIQAYAKSAYIYFGGRNSTKYFHMARPLLYSSGNVSPVVNINTNLIDEPISGTVSVASPGISPDWDAAVWDTSLWPSENIAFQEWSTINGIGYSAAMKVIVQANGQTVQWHGWDIMYSTGGLI